MRRWWRLKWSMKLTQLWHTCQMTPIKHVQMMLLKWQWCHTGNSWTRRCGSDDMITRRLWCWWGCWINARGWINANSQWWDLCRLLLLLLIQVMMKECLCSCWTSICHLIICSTCGCNHCWDGGILRELRLGSNETRWETISGLWLCESRWCARLWGWWCDANRWWVCWWRIFT